MENKASARLIRQAQALRSSHKDIEAAQIYTDLLRREPNNTQALYDMAAILVAAGEYRSARSLIERLLILVPDHHEGLCQAGYIAACLGDTGQAGVYYQKALDIRKSPDVCNKIGKLLLDLGYLDQAVVYFQQALSLDPAQPIYGENLVTAFFKAGKFADAFQKAADLLRRFPERKRLKNYLVMVARSIEVVSYDPVLEKILLQCLEEKGVDHQSLVSAWVDTVFFSPAFAQICARLGAEPPAWPVDSLEPFAPLMGWTFFRTGVRLLLPPSVRMESVLTRLRHALALRAVQAESAGDDEIDCACALAEQCFFNEYAYALTPAEEAAVAGIKAQVAQALQSGGPWPDSPAFSLKLAVWGCYEPLRTLPALVERAEKAARSDCRPSVRDLLACQIHEPLREAALAQDIPRLGIAEDAVSQKVREQYEENPYPRWREIFSESLSPTKPEHYKPFDILVAGCGTGRQLLIEKSVYPRSRILAIDLSRASLAYARRKCEEAGLEQVAFMQADILLLGQLSRTFDLVFASGVIHHMADPEGALRLLVERLKPGGILNLGLYSALARQHIAQVRQDIAAQGVPADAGSIRAYRQRIRDAAQTGEARFNTIIKSNDFYSLSACRDLLFHVQETCYTLGQIGEMLARNGLTFLGFSMLESGVIQRFSALWPAREDALDLEKWARFEQDNPGTFVSMYQFYVCRTQEKAQALGAIPLVMAH